MLHKLHKLRALLRETNSALVCFSGGVDSAFLLRVAADELGERAIALTADSPSLDRAELEQAQAFTAELGLRHLVLATGELDNPDYASNPRNRCYYCKTALLSLAREVAAKEHIGAILIGTNVDDLGDHRPGLRAAEENGARHPLVEAGLRKEEIRALSRDMGLPTWDKPEMACLASRFPYGTEITAERLDRVGQFEAELRKLGFRGLRVRFHETIARLELSPAQIPLATDPERREAIVAAGRRLGFSYIALDLQGYRRGALNEHTDQP